MTARQANQAIKDASREGKNSYYANAWPHYGIRVYQARTILNSNGDSVSQVRELNSGKWVNKSFTAIYHQ